MQRSERQPASSCYSICRRCTKGPPNQQVAAVPRNGLDSGNGDILESCGKVLLLGRYVKCRRWSRLDGGCKGKMCLEEVQRVVHHLDFQRSVAQTERYSLWWELCPKLHVVWKWDMASEERAWMERTDMQMIGGCVVPLWERRKVVQSWGIGRAWIWMQNFRSTCCWLILDDLRHSLCVESLLVADLIHWKTPNHPSQKCPYCNQLKYLR